MAGEGRDAVVVEQILGATQVAIRDAKGTANLVVQFERGYLDESEVAWLVHQLERIAQKKARPMLRLI